MLSVDGDDGGGTSSSPLTPSRTPSSRLSPRRGNASPSVLPLSPLPRTHGAQSPASEEAGAAPHGSTKPSLRYGRSPHHGRPATPSRKTSKARIQERWSQEADMWDVVDPAFATMNTWSQIQGVLFGPPLHPPTLPSWSDLVPSASPSVSADPYPDTDHSSGMRRRLSHRASSPPNQRVSARLESARRQVNRRPATMISSVDEQMVPSTVSDNPYHQGDISLAHQSDQHHSYTRTDQPMSAPAPDHANHQWAVLDGKPLEVADGGGNLLAVTETHAPPPPWHTRPDPSFGQSTEGLLPPALTNSDLEVEDHVADKEEARAQINGGLLHSTGEDEMTDQAVVQAPEPSDHPSFSVSGDTENEETGTKPRIDREGHLRASTSSSSSAAAASPLIPQRKGDMEKYEDSVRLAQEQEDEDRAVQAALVRLVSPRERFRRGIIGFGRYLKTPMGFLMVMYGLTITAWGIAIFLLIVGWWNPPNRRVWIERCDKILCVLFNLTGFLLAPSRARDTYRMLRISTLRRRALRRRQQLGIPPLEDEHDLPRSYAYRLYDTHQRRRLSAPGPESEHDARTDGGSDGEAEPSGAPPVSKPQAFLNRIWASRQERRRERKELARAQALHAGLEDRLKPRVALEAEMRVQEEAAAVDMAVSGGRGQHPPSQRDNMGASTIASLGSVAPVGSRGINQGWGRGSAYLQDSEAVSNTVSMGNKPHYVLSRIFRAARRRSLGASLAATQRSETNSIRASKGALSGPASACRTGREPQGDEPVSVSLVQGQNHDPYEITYQHQGQAPNQGIETEDEIEYHYGYRSQAALRNGNETFSVSQASLPTSVASTVSTASNTQADRKKSGVLVRSRSEYGAPKVLPGTYATGSVSEYTIRFSQDADYDSRSTQGQGRGSDQGQDQEAGRGATREYSQEEGLFMYHPTAAASSSPLDTLTSPDDAAISALPPHVEPAVLSLLDESELVYQQRKFSLSHPYYRYHETETHRAFSTHLALAIVILSDMHSCLQACLCGVTWGISYHHRPTVLTAMIVSASLTCNALAGVLIWLGGRKTKKTEVVQERIRAGLVAEARRRVRLTRAFEQRAADLAAKGENPYPTLQSKTPAAALTQLSLYDLNGRHELYQIHGLPASDNEGKKRKLWERLWGKSAVVNNGCDRNTAHRGDDQQPSEPPLHTTGTSDRYNGEEASVKTSPSSTSLQHGHMNSRSHNRIHSSSSASISSRASSSSPSCYPKSKMQDQDAEDKNRTWGSNSRMSLRSRATLDLGVRDMGYHDGTTEPFDPYIVPFESEGPLGFPADQQDGDPAQVHPHDYAELQQADFARGFQVPEGAGGGERSTMGLGDPYVVRPPRMLHHPPAVGGGGSKTAYGSIATSALPRGPPTRESSGTPLSTGLDGEAEALPSPVHRSPDRPNAEAYYTHTRYQSSHDMRPK